MLDPFTAQNFATADVSTIAVATGILWPPLLMALIKEGKEEGYACIMHTVYCPLCSINSSLQSLQCTL